MFDGRPGASVTGRRAGRCPVGVDGWARGGAARWQPLGGVWGWPRRSKVRAGLPHMRRPTLSSCIHGSAADRRAQAGSAVLPKPRLCGHSRSRRTGRTRQARRGGRGGGCCPPTALEHFVLAQPDGDGPAWRRWHLSGGLPCCGTEACAALSREGLRCYRNRRAGLNLVRQTRRPCCWGCTPPLMRCNCFGAAARPGQHYAP